MVIEEQWLTSSDGIALAGMAWNEPKARRAVFNLLCVQRVIDTVNFKPARKALASYAEGLWQEAKWDDNYYHRTKVRGLIALRERDTRQIAFRKWAALQALDVCLWGGTCMTVAYKAAVARSWSDDVPAPSELSAQADLAREVFGNIFQPVAFRATWHTSDTMALAKLIDEEQQFELLPVLGDALLDAGCEDEQVLAHCHSTKPHVRGCWLVDMVLGRSA